MVFLFMYYFRERDYLTLFEGLTKRDGQFIVSWKEVKDSISLSMLINYLYAISLLATSITGRTPTKTSVLCTSIL